MTDQIDPVADAPPASVAAAPEPPVRSKASSVRALAVLGGLVGLLVVLLFLVKDNHAAADLKVGDCFDIPTSISVQTVTHHACTEPHTGEVFLVADYTGSSMDTPLTLLLDGFVGATCDPAFATYVGKALDDLPDLSLGYFYPDVDSWKQGERTITCYVARTDQGPVSSSFKGSGAQ
jgi:hypothetical protein